jgi:hypothetical protein
VCVDGTAGRGYAVVVRELFGGHERAAAALHLAAELGPRPVERYRLRVLLFVAPYVHQSEEVRRCDTTRHDQRQVCVLHTWRGGYPLLLESLVAEVLVLAVLPHHVLIAEPAAALLALDVQLRVAVRLQRLLRSERLAV